MNFLPPNLTTLTDAAAAWLAWMAPLCVQLGVLVAVLFTIDRLLGRKAWPQLKSALWLLVFAKLLLPPTLWSPVGLANFTPVPEPFDKSIALRRASAASLGDFATAGRTNVHPQAATSSPAEVAAWLPLALMIAWAIVAGLLVARTLLRQRRLRRLLTAKNFNCELPDHLRRRLAELAASLQLRHVPRCVITARPVGPAVLGCFRPLVVLPEILVRCASRQELEHVLLHELAHVRRRDGWIDLVTSLLSAIFWFHPGVWFARRQLTLARELGCDQLVAEVLTDATPQYRRTLLSLSRPQWAPAGLPFFPRRSQLLERVERLAEPCRTPARWRACGAAIAFLVLAACLLPMAPSGSSATASELPPDEPPPKHYAAPPDRGLAEKIGTAAVNPPANPPITNVSNVGTMPPLDQLQGCMQLRFAVMAEMVKQEAQMAANSQ